jgi:hypothetical protein
MTLLMQIMAATKPASNGVLMSVGCESEFGTAAMSVCQMIVS